MMEIETFQEATILVVDDNPTNLEALSDYLTGFGLTVLLKRDGEKALELVKRKIPDLILLDIIMPVMDGFETCQRLKTDPETREIPVIFMSALSDTIDKVKGFEVGAVDYITKPFQYEEVLARVKAHLTIQNLQKDLQAKNKTLQELLERERKNLERERKFMEDLRLNLSISLPHELRTPLNNILGFAQLLMRPQGLPEPTKILECAENIYKGGRRLNRLMENSFLYANLKLLKYTPGDQRIWQSETVVEATRFITSVAQKKAKNAERQEDLVLELENTNIRISANNLKKILIELLDNAFKFSEADTSVRVKTTVNGHLCILSIMDQGRGMTEEQISNMGAYMQFERREYEQQGSGLGLIIAYLLAQLEGGVLSIDSKMGKGTTVSIVLNCEPELPEQQKESVSRWFGVNGTNISEWLTQHGIIGYTLLKPKEENQTLKILVIDDSSGNRAVLTDLLAPVGFEVFEAGSHDIASAALEYQPNLIFIDKAVLETIEPEELGQIQLQLIKIVATADETLQKIHQRRVGGVCSDVLIIPVHLQEVFDSIEVLLGVEWNYQEGKQPMLVIPPEKDREELNELAAKAELQSFFTRLEQIESLGEQYMPFTAKLRRFAKSYRFDLVQQILQRYGK